MSMPTRSRISYHTRDGFVSFVHLLLSDVEKVIVMQGAFGCNYSNLYKKIIRECSKSKIDVEIFQHPLLDGGIEGLWLKNEKLLIIDERLKPPKLTKKYEVIDLTNMLDNSVVMEHEREISNLQGEVQMLLPFVYKHFSEAGDYKKNRGILIDKLTNKQLLQGNKNKLLFQLFAKRPANVLQGKMSFRFFDPNKQLTTVFPVQLNALQELSILSIKSELSSNILEEVKHAIVKENFSAISYVNPISPNIPSFIYVPSLSTVISNAECYEWMKDAGANHQIIDFSQCLTSKYFDSEMKKNIFNIETNVKIKMTLAMNYLKEVKQRYNELTSIYNKSVIEDEENSIVHSILSKVKK